MRTTLELSDALLRVAKKQAAERGTTLTRLIEDALRSYLEPSTRPAKPFRLRLRIKEGPPIAGVDFGDRDSLYEWLDGR